MSEQRPCKTCKHLRVPLNKAGKRVVRKDDNYQCTAPVADMNTILPRSITESWQFRHYKQGEGRAFGGMISDCPTWEKLDV